MLYQERFVT